MIFFEIETKDQAIMDRNQQWEKIKYDSFLNSIEETFREHYSDDPAINHKLLLFSQQMIERFVDMYGTNEDEPLSLEARRLVMESILHNN